MFITGVKETQTTRRNGPIGDRRSSSVEIRASAAEGEPTDAEGKRSGIPLLRIASGRCVCLAGGIPGQASFARSLLAAKIQADQRNNHRSSPEEQTTQGSRRRS